MNSWKALLLHEACKDNGALSEPQGKVWGSFQDSVLLDYLMSVIGHRTLAHWCKNWEGEERLCFNTLKSRRPCRVSCLLVCCSTRPICSPLVPQGIKLRFPRLQRQRRLLELKKDPLQLFSGKGLWHTNKQFWFDVAKGNSTRTQTHGALLQCVCALANIIKKQLWQWEAGDLLPSKQTSQITPWQRYLPHLLSKPLLVRQRYWTAVY